MTTGANHLTERLVYWRQQIEGAVIVAYPIGLILATLVYLSNPNPVILEVSIFAGAAGVLVLLLFGALEAGLRRRFSSDPSDQNMVDRHHWKA